MHTRIAAVLSLLLALGSAGCDDDNKGNNAPGCEGSDCGTPLEEGLQPRCGDDPLAGTCAAALGAMFYECFQPAGSCTAAQLDDGSFRVVWQNGAQQILTDEGGTETTQVYAADGTLCGVQTQTFEQQDNDERIFTPEGGEPHGFRNEGFTAFITCPDGAEYTLESASGFAACSGLSFGCQIITSASCATDADCTTEGHSCCHFGFEAATANLCIPSEGCPTQQE